MKNGWGIVAVAGSVLGLAIGFAGAAEQSRDQQRVAADTQEQEQIYGSQLMTEQERMEYQTKMRSAKSDQEREQIRMEHHERMKVRAKEQGKTLPEEPPMKGGGMGMGMGSGPGDGKGMGMGPGPGSGKR